MALKVDIDPLRALELFYDGEKLGVPEEIFAGLERKNGLVLPKRLQKFLQNYAYLDINHDAYRVLMPECMELVGVRFADETVHDAWVIADTPHGYLAMLEEDYEDENPNLYLSSNPIELDNGEKEWNFEQSLWTLNRLFTAMFVDSPATHGSTAICDNPKAMQKLILEYDSEVEDSQKKLVDVFETSKRPGQYICWDAEERKFVIAALTQKRDFLAKFPARMSIQELEALFMREFYENQANCNYSHALKLLKRITAFYEGEKDESAPIRLGNYYKLAGLCCWKLKKQRSAEKWYRKAQKVIEQNLANAMESCREFYESLGRFSLDCGASEASQKAFERAEQVCNFAEMSNPGKKGERILATAIKAYNNGDYEIAIDICDEALVELKKDPKGCKYDIARCQQIRGDARKNLKKS